MLLLSEHSYGVPTHIEVGPERVLRIKPKFFGSTEEGILISKVASAQISTGMSGLTSTLTRPALPTRT
jgi:hypothetical protein